MARRQYLDEAPLLSYRASRLNDVTELITIFIAIFTALNRACNYTLFVIGALNALSMGVGQYGHRHPVRKGA